MVFFCEKVPGSGVIETKEGRRCEKSFFILPFLFLNCSTLVMFSFNGFPFFSFF
jgi:hypothetical protein